MHIDMNIMIGLNKIYKSIKLELNNIVNSIYCLAGTSMCKQDNNFDIESIFMSAAHLLLDTLAGFNEFVNTRYYIFDFYATKQLVLTVKIDLLDGIVSLDNVGEYTDENEHIHTINFKEV